MKSIYKTLSVLALLLCNHLAHAQEKDPNRVTFVRFVNLVAPGEGNLSIKVNGKVLWPAGYTLGQRTGGMGLREGTCDFVLMKEGCKTAERKIKMEGGETITLAAYAEQEEDKEGRLFWQIKVAQLKQQEPGDGYHITVVSFCKADVLPLEIRPATADSFTINAERLRTAKRQFASDKERVDVFHEEKHLTTLMGRNVGNYVVMAFEAEDGVKAVSFYDRKFILAN